ncbi:phosphatidylinositol 4-kinase type ii protein [Pyrenophora tritici-repentis]|nr:phosphatidylinositol 4-kinase type ii protein [Pyrenophora tritici-repentis]
MSKAKRPPTSGYARIAQAEEEEDSSSDVEGDHHQNSLSNSQYAPIQPQRNAGMRVNGSGANSPNQKSSFGTTTAFQLGRRHQGHQR